MRSALGSGQLAQAVAGDGKLPPGDVAAEHQAVRQGPGTAAMGGRLSMYSWENTQSDRRFANRRVRASLGSASAYAYIEGTYAKQQAAG